MEMVLIFVVIVGLVIAVLCFLGFFDFRTYDELLKEIGFEKVWDSYFVVTYKRQKEFQILEQVLSFYYNERGNPIVAVCCRVTEDEDPDSISADLIGIELTELQIINKAFEKIILLKGW